MPRAVVLQLCSIQTLPKSYLSSGICSTAFPLPCSALHHSMRFPPCIPSPGSAQLLCTAALPGPRTARTRHCQHPALLRPSTARTHPCQDPALPALCPALSHPGAPQPIPSACPRVQFVPLALPPPSRSRARSITAPVPPQAAALLEQPTASPDISDAL